MKVYEEEDYLMISGIQHFAFCRRQWALIHIEQQWAENVRTFEGELMHERAHDGELTEKRKDVIISRGMPVYSRTMGAAGTCDIVVFHRVKEGISLFKYEGNFEIYPIEYKRGRPKETDADLLQLAAQAMCLEEMLSCSIQRGALFYGETKRRLEIDFTERLRKQVQDTFAEMHKYYEARYTPKVKWTKACNACSLKELCLPQLGRQKSVSRYIAEHVNEKGEG
ncbi:MAG: CRISPR-associated protein Cas4 [Lachnospiraceae bacterium]|nr:CRISPR-associated protein Cas4 [Lachnospiraceae bacterium]